MKLKLLKMTLIIFSVFLILSIGHPDPGGPPEHHCIGPDDPHWNLKRSAFNVLKYEMKKQSAMENDFEKEK